MTRREHLVEALRDILIDAAGCGAPLEADGNIVDWMRADGAWDEIDIADVIWRIEDHIGLRLPRDEWKALPGNDATSADDLLTFRDLAVALSERLAGTRINNDGDRTGVAS